MSSIAQTRIHSVQGRLIAVTRDDHRLVILNREVKDLLPQQPP